MRTAKLPIHGRGGVVRAHALVDAEDLPRLALHRWHLVGPKKHVARWIRKGARAYLHHDVMGSVEVFDHINRNKLDNRRENLRPATIAENSQNQDSRGGISRHRGVTWDKERRKFRAQVMLDGRYRTLGRFDSEDEAGAVAAKFRAEHMPFSEDAALAAVA